MSLEGDLLQSGMAGVMKVRKKRKRSESSFTTLQGIVLSLSIGAFVALVFLLVALYWHPPQ
jgi:archaellum biogenesis protein FlaJ (TadC family)